MTFAGERRALPRARCALTVLCFLYDEQPLAAQTLDISAGGCALLLDEEVDICQAFRLHLLLPERVIRCAGRVRGIRIQQGHRIVGLEFGRMKTADRETLSRLVSRCPPSSPPEEVRAGMPTLFPSSPFRGGAAR